MIINNKYLIKLVCILVLIIIAITLRLAYLYKTEFVYPSIRGDAYNYIVYAKNLTEHGVFSKDTINVPPIADSYWAPGYPVFLAALIKLSVIFGADFYRFILYAQVLLGALIVLITVLTGQHFLKFKWACFAGLLVALSPHMVSLGSYILTETLFCFVLILSLYLFSRSIKYQKKNALYISAICFGGSYLVNPVIFFLPLFLAVWIYITQKSRIANIKFVGVIFLSLYLGVVASWSVRNAISVPENAVSTETRLLSNLIIGSHSNFFDIWRANPRDPENPVVIDENNFQGSYLVFAETLWDRFIDSPGHYFYWYLIKKPTLLWGWNILIGQGDIYIYPVVHSLYDKSNVAKASYSISKSLHPWLVVLAALSIPWVYFITKKIDNSPFNISLYFAVAYVSTVYIVTQSEARYSIPLRPEMYLCAMVTLSILVEWIKVRYRTDKNKEGDSK